MAGSTLGSGFRKSQAWAGVKAAPGFCMPHLATEDYITEFANLVYASLDTVALPETIQWIRNQAEVAREYGVDLIAYEGGQHLAALPGVWDNSAINQLFDDFNRDKRMVSGAEAIRSAQVRLRSRHSSPKNRSGGSGACDMSMKFEVWSFTAKKVWETILIVHRPLIGTIAYLRRIKHV